MTVSTFDSAAVRANFVALLNNTPMNNGGDELIGVVVGLRSQGGKHGIPNARKLSKADLVNALADRLTEVAKAEHVEPTPVVAKPAPVATSKAKAKANVEASNKQDKAAAQLHGNRNVNFTIRPTGDVDGLVDAVWTAITAPGGISTAALTAMVCAGTPGLQAGSVVGRLGSVRRLGKMASVNINDDHNRPVAFWSVCDSTWTKADMAKSFLKVK